MLIINETVIQTFYTQFLSVDDQPCTCGVVLGTHCGSRYNGGIMTGNCDFKKMYYCSAAYAPAQEKAYCAYCRESDSLGADYCAIGRKDKKSKLFFMK